MFSNEQMEVYFIHFLNVLLDKKYEDSILKLKLNPFGIQFYDFILDKISESNSKHYFLKLDEKIQLNLLNIFIQEYSKFEKRKLKTLFFNFKSENLFVESLAEQITKKKFQEKNIIKEEFYEVKRKPEIQFSPQKVKKVDVNNERIENLKRLLFEARNDIPEEIKAFKKDNNYEEIDHLKMYTLNDDMIFLIIKYFIDQEISYQNSNIFVNILYKKVKKINQIISRVLFLCLVHVSKLHPKSLIDSFILKLLYSEHFLNFQLELMNRLLDQLNNDSIIYLIENIHLKSIKWNEHVLTFFKHLVSKKNIKIDGNWIVSLLNELDFIASNYKSNMKMGYLIFTLLSKYENFCKQNLNLIHQILERLDPNVKKQSQNLLVKMN